jgi:hypothetical protein
VDDVPKPLTAEEAANMLGLTVKTLRHKALQGEIAYSQSGGIYWYWPHDVYRYLFNKRRMAMKQKKG